MFTEGKRGLARFAVLAPALVACALAVALFTPTSAVAACPQGKNCTDEDGVYNLTVPPLSGPIFGPYASCVWQVHITFGDSTSGDYVFEGEVGLSGSHTFPPYGEYNVTIALSGGHRKNNAAEACPNPTQYVTVLYQDPAKVAQEEQKAKEAKEQKEKEEKEAKGQPPEDEFGKKPGGGGSNGPGGGAGEEEREKGPSHPIHLWRNCTREVYAHKVNCTKARKVIRGAREKLPQHKTARVAGFRCHLTDELRPISCRRGKGRVIGPLG